MIKFKNITGDPFLAVGTIQRKFALNGEKSLSGVLYDGDDVLNNIDKGWSLEFDGEPYVVTYFERNDNDNTLSFDAVHKFFWNMSKSVLYSETSGSHTISWYLDQIFANTGYTYALNFKPKAVSKDNWGMKTKLALFNDIISSISGEFEINGTLISIFEKVGSDLSTIVRYGFNLSDMSIENDAAGFVTYGEGFGAYEDEQNQSGPRLHTTYTSPLASVYGILQAEPVDDQRYTIESNLKEAIKAKVDASFSVSIKLSLYDLTAAGYPYKMAHVGDWLMAIDERLGFKQRIRIISVDDEFDVNGSRISYTVTAGNVGVVQKYQAANASLASQINNALETANKASDDANIALISASGKNTSYYVDGFDMLPTTANEGDLGWVQAGDGRVLYIYTKKPDGTFYWEKRIDPEMQEQITNGVNKAVSDAKDYSDQVVFENVTQINQMLDYVRDKTAMLESEQAELDTKAKGYANKALADAKSDVTALDSKTTTAINQAKADAQSAVNALQVGGRNLILGTAEDIIWTADSAYSFRVIKEGLLPGETYTLSFEATLENTDQKITTVSLYSATIGDYQASNDNLKADGTRTSWTFTVPTTVQTPTASLLLYAGTPGTTSGKKVTYHHIKLEKGTFATDWAVAPEDVIFDYTNKDNVIKQSLTQYQEANDGRVTKVQSDATQALGELSTKVSQTTFNQKTSDLDTKYTNVKQTADKATTEIASIKSKDNSQDARMTSIENDANGTKTTVGYLQNTQGQQSGAISTLQQRANEFDLTVAKVNNLAVGGRNLITGTANDRVWTADTNSNYSFNVVATGLKPGQTYTFSAEVTLENTDQKITTISLYDASIGTWQNATDHFKADGTRDHWTFTVPTSIGSPTGSLLIYAGTPGSTAGKKATYHHIKLETGNVATDWSPALEDIEYKFATQKISIDGLTTTVSAQGDNLNSVMGRVITAEGSIETAKNDITGLQSTQTQTANQLATEISDRQTGDTNALMQAKDFTTSSISSSEGGMRSLITQTSDAILARVEATNMVVNSEFDPLDGTWYRITGGAPAGAKVFEAWKPEQSGAFQDWPVVNGSRIINYSTGNWYTSTLQVASAGKAYSASIVAGRSPAPTVSTALDFRIAFWDGNRALIGTMSSGNIIDGTSYKGIQKYVVENKIAPANTRFVSVVIAHSSGNATDYITRPSLNIGEKASPYAPTYGTNASSTVLALLKDNWSIGIADNIRNITSGIVGNANSMSLISDRVIINAPQTQIKGTAWINRAMIGDGQIGTAQIGDAAITNAKVADLDVNKLTGNVSNFIQSNWNGKYASTTIDGSGMLVNGGNTTTKFDTTGAHYTNSSGISATYSFGRWSDANHNATSSTGLYLGATGSDNSFINILGTNGAAALVLAGSTMDYGANQNIMQGTLNAYVNVNIRQQLHFKGNKYNSPAYIEINENTRTFNFFTGGGSQGGGNYFWFNQNVLSAGSFSSTSVLSKKNVKSVYDEDALSEIAKTQLVNFAYKNRPDQNHVSPIIDDVNEDKQFYIPKTILGQDGEYVDMYSMISMAWRAIQQLNDKIGDR